ncbi:MAG: efflux RND transporter periplasmic adaptor subunit [Candidatus Hydrogenedentes bacterium]|nr:efflux RND transporter periplasmic adaptor subunit [Candidatus Hydrogenedentota bacterium]
MRSRNHYSTAIGTVLSAFIIMWLAAGCGVGEWGTEAANLEPDGEIHTAEAEPEDAGHADEDASGSHAGHDDHAEEDPDSHEGHDNESEAEHEGHAGEDHEEHVEGMVHLPPERLEGLNISVVPVHAGTVDSTLTMPAEVKLDPDNEAHLVPRVRGIVREVHVGIGDRVVEGDLLAVLDSRELAGAKSEYLAALAMRDLAQTTFAREKGLWEDKISAEQDYLQAKAEYQAAQIQVQTAEQQLHALGLSQEEVDKLPQAQDTTLTRYEIRAPFDATVVERHITLGETVGEDDEVFFIAKLDPIWVMGRATERDLRRIEEGQKAIVQLDALPDNDFSAEIDYLGSVLDPESRTLNVRVVLPNPDGQLRAGLFGRMLVFVDEHEHEETILVPNEALQRTDTGAIVYKTLEEGEFKAVPVSVLHTSDTFTEVQGDLNEGDRIAAGDVFVLKSEAGKESMGGGHSH